jgi:hypothetical protein
MARVLSIFVAAFVLTFSLSAVSVARAYHTHFIK